MFLTLAHVQVNHACHDHDFSECNFRCCRGCQSVKVELGSRLLVGERKRDSHFLEDEAIQMCHATLTPQADSGAAPSFFSWKNGQCCALQLSCLPMARM